MDSYEVFCAICSAAVVEVEIGSTSPLALARRRQLVERKSQLIEVGEASREDAIHSDHEGESDKGSPESWGSNDGDDDDSIDKVAEDSSYDPELVPDPSWLMSIRGLGFNSAAGKAYVSGLGELRSGRSASFAVGDDEHQPGAAQVRYCYVSHENDAPVFPVHISCYNVLGWAIARLPSPRADSPIKESGFDIKAAKAVNKNGLYDTMAALASSQNLNIDYGEISGVDRYWNCIPGEEHTVTDPTYRVDLETLLLSRITEGAFAMTSTRVSILDRIITDPFSALPLELLQWILKRMPGKDVLSLRSASIPFYNATDSSFWRGFIEDDMPWCWELFNALSRVDRSELSYLSLYIWLERSTTPEFGMRGPLLPLANRRRIWTACQQIVPHYFSMLNTKETSESDDEAQQILQQSLVLFMPIVAHPRREVEPETTTSQWAYSWKEARSCPATFETYWNTARALVGIGVVVGTSRRMLGYKGANGTTSAYTRDSASIDGKNGILRVILHLSTADLLAEDSTVAIIGVTLGLVSCEKTLGVYATHQLTLKPSEQNGIVGVVGQTREDGVICRLGLLECPKPEGPNLAETNQADQKLLSSLNDPSRAALQTLFTGTFPSNVPKTTFVPVATAQTEVPGVPESLVPRQSLIWATEFSEMSKVSRISAYVMNNATTSDVANDSSDVLGFRAEFIRKYWEPKRYIGIKRMMTENDDWIDWPEDRMVHFDIDGPGGEYVVEVEARVVDTLRAVKLRTNRGRAVVFGQDGEGPWISQKSADGGFVHGLAVAFGFRGGLIDGASKDSYLKMSSVMLLDMQKSATYGSIPSGYPLMFRPSPGYQ